MTTRPGRRAVVTGAAGFIGSHLCERLLEDGWRVTGVDCFTDYYARDDKLANLEVLADDPRFDLLERDLAGSGWQGALRGAGAVFHLAAQAGVRGSFGTSFTEYAANNLVATQRVFEAAGDAGVRRVVWASSSSVYGDAEAHPCREASTLTLPRSPYGVTKRACEDLARIYRTRDLAITGLRYFTVYGPRQRPDMANHRFIEAMLDHRPIEVFGDGSQVRDFTYVADVVAAISAAVTAPVPPGAILNVARGEPVAVRDLIAMLAEELGAEPRIEHRPHRTGDTPRTEGCADAARELLGWEPVTDLRTGIREQVAWHVGRRSRTQPSSTDATVHILPRPRCSAEDTGFDEVRQGLR
jgi:UDP-glucuronate 4-epimerase